MDAKEMLELVESGDIEKLRGHDAKLLEDFRKRHGREPTRFDLLMGLSPMRREITHDELRFLTHQAEELVEGERQMVGKYTIFRYSDFFDYYETDMMPSTAPDTRHKSCLGRVKLRLDPSPVMGEIRDQSGAFSGTCHDCGEELKADYDDKIEVTRSIPAGHGHEGMYYAKVFVHRFCHAIDTYRKEHRKAGDCRCKGDDLCRECC